MQTLITQLFKSGEYTQAHKYIMSNFDHEIDSLLAEESKREKKIYSYSALNFHADIIWKDEKYICEVFSYHVYRDTIESNDLQEIMDICCERFGSD